MSVRVALVVRCFNEEAHIGRLLTGVGRQRRRPDQVVVVDSGSTDATLPIAQQFDVDIVSIDPREFSFGRALNVGLAATDCDLAVLASAHVYPAVRHVDRAPDRALRGSRGRARPTAQQRAPGTASYSEQQILRRWFPTRSEPAQDHPFCNNANAAIRRSVWLDLPYDERLTGLEDLAWAKRALELGNVLAYVADAPIIHVHEESFSQIVNRYRREAIAHKEIYPEQSIRGAAAVRLGLVQHRAGSARRAPGAQAGRHRGRHPPVPGRPVPGHAPRLRAGRPGHGDAEAEVLLPRAARR